MWLHIQCWRHELVLDWQRGTNHDLYFAHSLGRLYHLWDGLYHPLHGLYYTLGGLPISFFGWIMSYFESIIYSIHWEDYIIRWMDYIILWEDYIIYHPKHFNAKAALYNNAQLYEFLWCDFQQAKIMEGRVAEVARVCEWGSSKQFVCFKDVYITSFLCWLQG